MTKRRSLLPRKKTAHNRETYKPRKTPQERMKELADKRGSDGKPLWDLDRDGVTYSMLSRFLVDRERFRLRTVEGWSETGLEAALEFGSAFHRCLEDDRLPGVVVAEYMRQRIKDKALFPNQYQEFHVLMGMVEAVVHAYKRTYGKTDFHGKKFLYREKNFRVTYDLMTNGRTFSSSLPSFVSLRPIDLRGRWDAVIEDARGDVWVFETKTKSDIDHDGISRTLAQDLQTMLYATSVELSLKRPVRGVIYNVIKRPALRQGKRETLPDFVRRVRDTALDQQDKYFFRWTHTLGKNELKTWQQRTLNPLLMQMLMWWDSIKKNPFDPWDSPFHCQTPFGVYNSLASGRRGDFFELLTGGTTSGLKKAVTPFPELEQH